MAEAVIVGVGTSRYTRHPPVRSTTERVLVEAMRAAITDAGLHVGDVDGLGVSSFTLGPDHAIDLAWRAGLRLRWIVDDSTGGASGLNMLGLARRAIEAGDADAIVLVAGDRILGREFIELVDNYNVATRDHLAPIPFGGPNAVFALLTQRHMSKHRLQRADYGWVPIVQRRWARRNPGAVYRRPLSMNDYLTAPAVAPPLHRFDCVPVVTGANAIVVGRADRDWPHPTVRLRALRASHNGDQQEGDGLRTGLADVGTALWDEAGLGPGDVDLVHVYDDYPVIVLIQLAELGFVERGDVERFIRTRLAAPDLFPLNTSGGMLSAGQAGAAGGMLGLAEVVVQLRGAAGARQVTGARRALVSGYGMVLYRHGACANAAVLERVR
jgi:acetyl-CoA acetyltransferase